MDQNSKITVFRRVSQYLTINEIMIIQKLNKYFQDHFMNTEMKYVASLALLPKILLLDIAQENYLSEFYSQTGISISQISDAYDVCKNASNLIKNPNGEFNFDSWQVEHGGNGWRVDGRFPFKNECRFFEGSYEMGRLTQTVDIPNGTQNRKLYVGTPISRRFDCGNISKLKVTIYQNDNRKKSRDIQVEPE